MKKNRFSVWGLAAALCLLSACKASHSHDGTYEGVLPAADCPGIYIMLAIDGDRYELMEKYVLHPETYLTYGTAKTVRHGERLELDNDMEVEFRDNGVWCRNTLLQPCSDEKKIPEIYAVQFLKEYQSGEDATLKLYEKKGQQYADFRFKGKNTTLPLNAENIQIDEYISGSQVLQILPETEKGMSPGILSYKDETGTYAFARLTPTHCVYNLTGTGTGDVPSFLDAMYYNNGEQAFVKLIHNAPGYCYTLPQTEASAKTAIYTDGNVEWRMGNQQNGTLIIQNQKYTYRETR